MIDSISVRSRVPHPRGVRAFPDTHCKILSTIAECTPFTRYYRARRRNIRSFKEGGSKLRSLIGFASRRMTSHERSGDPPIKAKRIEDIEGIGVVYGEKLRAAGCGTVARLLEDGASRRGREAIANKTGMDAGLILRCVNMADLFRIKGVAAQYAELLEAAGVDTVKELRNRKARNLHQAIHQTNQKRRLVRQVPSEKMVAAWIDQAKELKPVVNY